MTSEKQQTHGLWSIFGSKTSYHHFAHSFHQYHKHDLNALSHLFTSGLGFWGAIQLALLVTEGEALVWAYAGLILATTPLVTGILHTAFVYGCLQVPVQDVLETIVGVIGNDYSIGPMGACAVAIALGFGLQDLSHWLCAEPTLLSSYIYTEPLTLFVHTFWLMPLVIDSILMRHFFFPKLFVSRNRNFFFKVASTKAVEELREWINQEVPEIPVST